jgi:hypothetical protein
VVPEDRGCGLPGGQSAQEQSPGESPSSTPVPVGYREDVREISKLVADDEREDPRGDSLGAQARPEPGYVEADVAGAAASPACAGSPQCRSPMRAARQAAAGRTRRHCNRSFGGSKRRLSLKFRADIVVVAPWTRLCHRPETAFPGSRMRTFKKPYGGVGSSYLRVRYARLSSDKSDHVDQNVSGFGLWPD